LEPTLHLKADIKSDALQTILLINAGERHFSYALMNQVSKEIVEFSYYNTDKINEEAWAGFFDEQAIFSERYFLSAIVYNVTESILIPAELYNADEIQLQFKSVYGQKVHTSLISEYISDWNIYNIYGVPDSLHLAISRKFNNGKFWNSNSIQLKNYNKENPNSIHIDFRTDEFSLVVFKNETIHIAQTYTYASPEDVLFCLLKICQQFDIKQTDVKMFLSGLIEKDSSVFRELYKYFIHLDFYSLPAEFRLAEALKEYPDHYYSSICKLAQCVL